MQNGDVGTEQLPFVHWPSIIHPAPQAYLALPLPAPPTVTYKLGAEEQQQDALADPTTLPSLICALQSVDVSYLQPLRAAPPGAGEPRTALQKQVAEAAPGIFSGTQVPAPTTAPLLAKPRRTAAKAAAVAPSIVAQPVQQQVVSPHAVALPARVADKPPAAKRARVAHVAVAAARAQEEMPAEGASKAAEAYTAFITDFVARHEKAAAELGDARQINGTADDNGGHEPAAEEASDGEEEEEEEAVGAGASSAGSALLRAVRRLCGETLRMCRADHVAALRAVPLDPLLRLLRLLHRLVKSGAGRLLEPGDTERNPRAQSILVSVEAAAAALHLMTVPDMPARVYNEDLMEAVLDLVRFQLTYNIYPFHDARLRSAARPKLAAAAAAAAAAAEAAAGASRKLSAKKAREAEAAGVGMPPAMSPLLDRCQALLLLAAGLLRGVRLPAAAALPLLRAAAVGLAVEGQALLQEKAVRLLVAAFREYPAQWGSLLDELFAHVVPHLGGGPRVPRDFPASEDARTCVQMLTAAVLQMIQGCVDLPPMDCPPERLADCYKGAATCADYFWMLCFDRLPGARGAKAESDLDVRPLLSALLRDLLACAHLPAWPAAPFLLLRLAALLQGKRGLRHADPHVRQHSLDLLASLAAQLYADEVAVAADAPQLRQLAQEFAGSDDVAEEAPGLLLAYLSDPRRASHAATASARAFLLCQAFAEEVTHLQKAGAAQEQLTEKLVQYRRQREELEAQGAEVGLDAEQAQRLTRYMVQSSLGRARGSMVQWLLDCLAPAGQAPTTRCKAVRALGEVAAADPRVLDAPGVQAAVERALQDEAISVREAAVSLLGRHAAANQALALRLFATLARAATDPGTSVRKSAIKILWESCIRAPGFPLATDACKHVLMRAADPEESIQDMVARVFHSLWFTPRLEVEEGGARVARSAAQRAQQLADVAAAVYEAGGRAIHLPLEQAHPLVAVLRAALGAGARGDLKREVAAGREVAAALLDLFLTAQETSQTGEQAGFPHLLALHAFAVTDVDLCMPPSDAGKFVRSLAPYLKVAPDSGEGGEVARRRGAEALLCVLSVLGGVLGQQARCEAATLAQLLPDLLHLVNRHPYVQVLAAAAACLTTLAAKEAAAATQLAGCAAFYAARLREAAAAAEDPAAAAPQQPALLCRFLFILGQLCRRGADVLEATPPEGGAPPLAMAECQRIFVSFCGAGQKDLKVAEAALGAIGALTIARPAVMVDNRSAAHRIMKAALQRTAPEPLKLKALSNLIDLLRADEDDMLAAQADGGEALGGAAPQPKAVGAAKRRGRKSAAAAAEEAAAAAEGRGLATQNGQGETLSQSSSILQDNWPAVLALATDTTPAAPGAAATSPPGSAGGADLAPGTHVRRRAIELMEIVLRGGLVGPWTAVAPLMALAADPLEEVRGRALRLLRTLCDKHPRYLDADRLCSGVVEAYRFRGALAQASGGGYRGWEGGAPPQALAGLSAVYVHLIQPRFQLKCDFLRGLLKRLRLGACLLSAGAAEADPRLLAFCAAVAAGLPYRRGDEPCLVVQEINAIVSRSGESVKEELKRSLYGTAAAAGSPAAAPTSPGPASVQLMAQCKASLALSLLLLVKEYLKAAYSVNGERIVAFAAAGERRRAEEKVVVSALPAVPTHLDKLDLGAHRDPQRLRAQYKLFKQLMKRDAADYGHLLASGRGKRGGSEEPEALGSGGGGGDVTSPGGEPGDDATPGWMEGLGQAPAGTGHGRGRGGRGGRGGRSTGRGGRGRGSTAGGRGRKKRKAAGSSDEEDDSGGSGDDYEPRPRAASTRKRLPMTH